MKTRMKRINTLLSFNEKLKVNAEIVGLLVTRLEILNIICDQMAKTEEIKEIPPNKQYTHFSMISINQNEGRKTFDLNNVVFAIASIQNNFESDI
jgi:hypothetical protein